MFLTSLTIRLAAVVMVSVGENRHLGGHKVGGGHSAQSNGVVIGALIAHNADAAHIGQRGKILAGTLGHGQLIDFLAPDGVGVLHNGYLFGGNVTDDADGQTRAGERLAGHQIPGRPNSRPA